MSAWSEKEDRLMAELLCKGYSARKISEALNQAFQTTRSRESVLGRIRRSKKAIQARKNQWSKTAPALAANVGGRVKSCQWPHGDPGTAAFHFCGAKALAGKPYCEAHCARAYRKKDVTAEEAGKPAGEGVRDAA